MNDIHLLNPSSNSNCLFYIITQLAILYGYNNILNNQLQLRLLVSTDIYNPSNGTEYIFTELSLEELRNYKRNQSFFC